MFVAVIGYRAAGFASTAAGRSGIMLVSTTLAFADVRRRRARRERRGEKAFKAGLATLAMAPRVVPGRIGAARTSGGAHALPTLAAASAAWRKRVRPPTRTGAGARALLLR